jgi:ATP-dependent Lhr-like helicase
LLDAYGVVTRDTVAGEGLTGGFSAVYPILREMEERGRVRRGYFVEGLGGAQFCIPAALDRLRAERGDPGGDQMPGEALILAASDPANPYGASLSWPRWSEEDRRPLARAAGAYVVLIDGQPVIYLERGGKSLQTLPAFADTGLAAEALNALRQLVADGRFRSIQIERVDGLAVGESKHAEALAGAGFQRAYRGWLLRSA